MNFRGSDTDTEVELHTLTSDLVYGLMPACHEYCSSGHDLIGRRTPAVINLY
jgi:hypothetical protein